MLNIADIILVKGSVFSLADDAIMLGELIHDHSDKYVHVAIYIGSGLVAEAQGGRLSGKQELKAYAGHYDIGHVELTDLERMQIVAEAQKEYGMHYDWGLIADIAKDILTGQADLDTDATHERICTTYVKSVFRNAINLNFDCGDTPVELSDNSRISIEKL